MDMLSPVFQPHSVAVDSRALSNQASSQDYSGSSGVVKFPPTHEHGKVTFLHSICADCPFVSSTKSDLEQHALNFGHLSFPCICGAQFARSFCLTRHINSKIGPSFRCGLCDEKSFPRLDKLGDHLRRWHRLGDKAFDLCKDVNSCASSVSLTAAGNQPAPAADPQQNFPMLPTFGNSTAFNGLHSASSAAPDVSSAEPCASSGTFTATDNWWYPTSCDFSAYPPELVL